MFCISSYMKLWLILTLLALFVLCCACIWTFRVPAFLPLPCQFDEICNNWQEISKEVEVIKAAKPGVIRYRHDWGAGLQAFVDKLELNERWIKAWARDGSWENYPLMIDDKILPGDTASICPLTWQLLSKLKGIKVAGFSKVANKGKIEPHTDEAAGLSHGQLAFHLGLTGTSVLRVNGQPIEQYPGRALVFDPERVHEVQNPTDSDRILLYVNFSVER